MSQFTPAAVKPTVSRADVEKLDVRVGTILSVDDVPNSVKLLKLTVNFGDHTRTILAGMKAERSRPQEIVGRQTLFVVNLEPKRMAGEESQGMLFDIGFADGVRPAGILLQNRRQLVLLRRRGRRCSNVARQFLAQGVTSMLLFGDAANPSNGFYEAFGAERLYSDAGEFHGGYGWRDLRLLVATCNPDS